MTDRNEIEAVSDVETVTSDGTDVDAVANRRKAIGRILTLAAAAPMAALLFKPGSASASIPP